MAVAENDRPRFGDRPPVAVAHLVRAKNGVEPFRRFIESYLAHPPGIPCDLLIIFKGFPRNRVPPDYADILKGRGHVPFFVDDKGFDILPYFKTAERFAYDYYCFLNSYSIILADDWLGKIYTDIRKRNVGLVGATGSYQSIYSGSTEWKKRGLPLWKRVLGTPWKLYLKMYFDPYPNYHIRTTAFMISRDVMLKIRHGKIRMKMDAWRFESGKRSLTKQVLAMGLKVLISGKDGRAYEKENWHNSGIFWQGEQENLLVADKQTLRYTHGDSKERQFFKHFAWWEDWE
jgi:hypothetical protein